jgi:predicted Zn-dependent peptidase
MVFGFRAGDVTAAERPALEVLSMLISERLVFRIREERGLCYSMSAGFAADDVPSGEIDLFGARTQGDSSVSLRVFVATSPDKVDQVHGETRRELYDKSFEVTQADIDRRVAALDGRERMRTMARINRCYDLGLALFAGEATARSAGQRLGGVTADEVKTLAKRLLTGDRKEIVVTQK